MRSASPTSFSVSPKLAIFSLSISTCISGFPISEESLTSAVPGTVRTTAASPSAAFRACSYSGALTRSAIGDWLAVPNMPIGLVRTCTPGICWIFFLMASLTSSVDRFRSSLGTSVTFSSVR